MIRPGDVIEINGTQFELLNDTSAVNTNITRQQYQPTVRPTRFTISTRQAMRTAANFGAAAQRQRAADIIRNMIPRAQHRFRSEAELPQKATSPYWTNASPYKILRQPTLTSDEPYQMPEGTAIDLRASGVGADNYFYVPKVHDNDQNILVLFTPEGRVARVTYSMGPPDKVENDQAGDQFDQAVVDNVYLLVGRRDRIEADRC